MLHFTCDSCGKPLNDERFVARVEVYPAYDPEEISEEDLDADHLEEMSALLADMETGESGLHDDCSTKSFRFDLCLACQKKFVEDPLGRERKRRLNFSEN